MQTVRTPDEHFENLSGYAFTPNYVEIDDLDGGTLRVHYLDEGPADGSVVLLMHGEPSWSYLYRNVIPPLVDSGHRVIAPDLVGFGRSDKPTQQSDYTYARHVDWMRQVLFDHLNLTGITFFGQDWGGLVGLRLVALEPERYAGVVIGNTGLPTGRGPASDAFLAWQNFAATTEHFPVGAIINGGCTTDLAPEIIADYEAPFPSDEHTAGARVFPSLVPTRPDDPATPDQDAAWTVLEAFDRPFLLAFSDSDPITRGGDAPFLAKVPGAAGQPHTTIVGGGHFLQEDRPADVAAAIRMVTGR